MQTKRTRKQGPRADAPLPPSRAANVFESELIFAEFERAVFTFVRWCGEEARPWDPPPPPPAETEGEEGAAVAEEDPPHPEAPPPAEGEAGEEGGEEGAEAAVEAEPEEPPLRQICSVTRSCLKSRPG